MKKYLAFLLLFFAPALHAQCAGGGTCPLSSPSASALQSALNTINTDGTIVSITGTIGTGTVTYTQTNSFVLQGTTTVAGTCGPAPSGGTCVPTDGTVWPGPGGAALLTLTTIAGKSVRITGFRFSIPTNATAVFGDINIRGTGTSMRFDHNHVVDLCGCTSSGDHFLQWDANPGVEDHNY